MKNTLVYSIGALLIGCSFVFFAMQHNTQPQQVATGSGMVSVIGSVSPAQFEELEQSGEYTVLDVRTEEEADAGKVVADAIVVDYYRPDFRAQLAQLDREQPYLIYCRSGNRTGDTLKIMQSLGFSKVRDLKGGAVAWEQSGRPLVVPETFAVEEEVEKTMPSEMEDSEEEPVLIACPMDAKLCPDGSSVGRTGPDCEFIPCG